VIDSTAKSTVDKVVESYGGKVSTSVSPLTSSVGNKVEMLQNNQNNVASQTTNSKIDIGGKLEINVTAPLGISTEQLKQSFDTAFNSN
jgi:hypothetical protein